MRKLLSYTLIALLLGGMFFLFWDEISSFWKKTTLIATIITGIFACKDFISWAFHFVLHKFSSLFKWFIALITSFFLFWGGYNALPEQGSVKTNIDEMKSSIGNFFQIPKPTAYISDDEVVTIPSSSESGRNSKILTSGDISNITTEEGERIMIYTDSSSDEIERNNTNNPEIASIDPLDALLNDESDIISSGQESMNEVLIEKVTEEEQEIEQEIADEKTRDSIENINSNALNSNNENKNEITEISFADDSEENWKTPVVQILNSPEATSPIIVKTEKNINAVAATQPQIKNTNSKNLISSGSKLPSSGSQTEKFKILFRELPVQIVYPVEYSLSNALWTDKENTLDTVSFSVTTPQKTKANISIDITDSGKIYNKYVKSFINKNSTDENLFFIESTSSQSITYVSFFAGNCWEITISLPENKAPTLNDFYEILLPAVFEAQE